MSAQPGPSACLSDDAVSAASACFDSCHAFGLEMLARFHAAEVCLVVNAPEGMVFTANYRRPVSRAMRAMAAALPALAPIPQTLSDTRLDAAGAHVLAEFTRGPSNCVAYVHPRRSVLDSTEALGFEFRFAETYLARWHEAWLTDRLADARRLCALSPSARFQIRFAGGRARLWVEPAQQSPSGSI